MLYTLSGDLFSSDKILSFSKIKKKSNTVVIPLIIVGKERENTIAMLVMRSFHCILLNIKVKCNC